MNIKLNWKSSIKRRQLTLLFAILLFNLVCSYLFFVGVSNIAEKAIYEKMEAQANYYLDSVGYQMEGIMKQQVNFFTYRKLFYLASEGISLSGYDKREALLSTQERLFIIISSNTLIQEVALYIPYTNYVITPYKIDNFKEEDWLDYEAAKDNIGRMTLQNGEFYYALVESLNSQDSEPNFLLKVVFDQKQLVENLNDFTTLDGGSFCYQENIDLFLEDTKGTKHGVGILQSLKERSLLDEGNIEELSVSGEKYFVTIAHSDYLGWFVQYYSKDAIMSDMNIYTKSFFVFMIGSIAMTILFSNYTEKIVNQPLKKLHNAFEVVESGNINVQINHSSQDEFRYIYEGFNHMTSELHRLIDEVYIQKDLIQKAELKQLQAQINPHFLYNSFFVLSRRVKRGDLENAQIFAQYLGTYFQFLTRNTSDTVELSKEIEHAECYAKIQGTRFVARMKVELGILPEAYAGLIVPRLIVQPLLENAFEHGLENMEESGILSLHYSVLEDGIQIHIENNGEVADEQIKKVQAMLDPDYQEEVTGLINIHRRLQSYYKGQGGLKIERGPLGGMQVTIVIREGQQNV